MSEKESDKKKRRRQQIEEESSEESDHDKPHSYEPSKHSSDPLIKSKGFFK